MGYTHYWKRKSGGAHSSNMTIQSDTAEEVLPQPVWSALQKYIAATVTEFRAQGHKVGFEQTDTDIWINGDTEESQYEDFIIRPSILDFDCCKTEHRGYDTVVVAALVGMAATDKYLLSSDGNADDLYNGFLLATQCSTELKAILSESGVSPAEFENNLRIFFFANGADADTDAKKKMEILKLGSTEDSAPDSKPKRIGLNG